MSDVDFLYEIRSYQCNAEHQESIDNVIAKIKQLQNNKEHILDVMETMIPLTVCDDELKKQWKRLIKESRE